LAFVGFVIDARKSPPPGPTDSHMAQNDTEANINRNNKAIAHKFIVWSLKKLVLPKEHVVFFLMLQPLLDILVGNI
jgi:hypothetical protein